MTGNQAAPAQAGRLALQAATAHPHHPAGHHANGRRPADLPLAAVRKKTALYAAPAYYQARPATGGLTTVRRQVGQLIRALTRRARRLHLPRVADYKLEPMPRMRWYS